MTPPNPWFLITFEQIAAIRLNLQVVMEVVPETHRDKVKKIAAVMDEVEWQQT
jgi:hypothetical protein